MGTSEYINEEVHKYILLNYANIETYSDVNNLYKTFFLT